MSTARRTRRRILADPRAPQSIETIKEGDYFQSISSRGGPTVSGIVSSVIRDDDGELETIVIELDQPLPSGEKYMGIRRGAFPAITKVLDN